jgi:hypothetical protein
MKFATAIWARFRVRRLSVVVFIFALSVSGWAQQTSLSRQECHVARKHTGTIEYRNTKYGFRFTLPESWKGYQVLWSDWEGGVLSSDGTETPVLRGPKLEIRHPKWTDENPREDMPIMIFTIAQWNKYPIVSAAPFGPGELGRNRKYVFAVPPRWDYDFAEGWEEAQKILACESLHTFAPAK